MPRAARPGFITRSQVRDILRGCADDVGLSVMELAKHAKIAPKGEAFDGIWRTLAGMKTELTITNGTGGELTRYRLKESGAAKRQRLEKLSAELAKVNAKLQEQAKPPVPQLQAPALPAAVESLGAQLLNELITKISTNVKTHMLEELRVEHARLRTDFAQQVSGLLQDLEQRLYQAFGGPTTSQAADPVPPEKLSTDDLYIEHTLEANRNKLPKVGVFRLEVDQAHALRKEFNGKLDLTIALSKAPDQHKQAQRMASSTSLEQYFVITKHVGHSEERTFKGKPHIRVNSIANLKKALHSFVTAKGA